MLNEVLMRGGGTSMPPTDPSIYRLYELVLVNGSAWNALIEGEFGDGIMPASDFDMPMKRQPNEKGDRIKLTTTGKFCRPSITTTSRVSRPMASRKRKASRLCAGSRCRGSELLRGTSNCGHVINQRPTGGGASACGVCRANRMPTKIPTAAPIEQQTAR